MCKKNERKYSVPSKYRASYEEIVNAHLGDTEAIDTIIMKYERYMMKNATVLMGGAPWFSLDLYELYKAKLVKIIANFVI